MDSFSGKCLTIICGEVEVTRETIVNLLDDVDLILPPTAMLEHLATFGYCYYQYIKCRPMSSPIPRLIVEAVLQRLERLVFAVIELR